MEISNKFNQIGSPPDLGQTLKMLGQKTAQELNCMRVGIVQAVYPGDPETQTGSTVDVLLTNKKLLGLNKDGSQKVRDFGLINAKVCYCNPFETFPISISDECLVFFADRELESWYTTGETAAPKYSRMHDLTDAIAVFGIRSLPKTIQILANCLNLFYGESNIALSEQLINITSPLVQVSNLEAMNGATGSIVDSQGKTLANIKAGIVTEIF